MSKHKHLHPPVTKNTLNPVLIKRQNLTDQDVEHILNLHEQLHEVFNQMCRPEMEFKISSLRSLSIIVKQLEYDLQEAWGFERNENYHSWWFRVPYCSCPVFDNWERVGTDQHIINNGCPVHGGQSPIHGNPTPILYTNTRKH